jgi:cytochrome c553
MPGTTLAGIRGRIKLISVLSLKRIRALILALSLAPAPGLAAPDFQAMGWAFSCITCHGGADAASGSGFPRLVDLPAGEIQAAMREFAAGSRPGLLMPQIAKGYDEATIERIAKWFESIGDTQQ